jgi:hypothetical protein
MSAKLTVIIVLLSGGVALAGDFESRFPSCKVYAESHCNQRYESVGSRMDCYRNFMESSGDCRQKVRNTIRRQKEDLIRWEESERSVIKKEASNKIETNYTNRAGTKIDDMDAMALEKIEAAKILRSFMSYQNRAVFPQIKLLSSEADKLIAQSREVKIKNQAPKSIIEEIDKCSQRTNVLIENFLSYYSYYRPQLQGLRFEENRVASVSILDSTKLLIQEAYDISSALSDLIIQLKAQQLKSTGPSHAKAVTKGELTLQKIQQTKMKMFTRGENLSGLRSELAFYQKLCVLEYPSSPEICIPSERVELK